MLGDLLKMHTLEEIKGRDGIERLVEFMKEDGQANVRQDAERGLDPKDGESDNPHTEERRWLRNPLSPLLSSGG